MVRVLPIHFGVVLGCKGGGGKKETYFRSRIFFFFQVQLFQTELQARYSTMPGLEALFWRGINRLQRRRGEENNFFRYRMGPPR